MSLIKNPKTRQIVIATHNAGKYQEICDLLTPHGLEPISAARLKLEEPEETGSSFAANAALKARYAARKAGLPALADDSGLAVDALFGDPGIYSARWAGLERNFAHAAEKIEQALHQCQSKDFSAHFVCALGLAWPDGTARIFEGRVHGKLVFPGRGNKGFGYDPIFIAAGHDLTFGEMEPEQKHAISHRAVAFAKLLVA